MNKYYAKPVIWDSATKKLVSGSNQNTIHFASTFEFEVYRELVRLVGVRNLKLQVPLRIKEATGIYPELWWRCDFRIYRSNNLSDYLNIEAKGLPTREFKRNMQYLEAYSPIEFDRLLVIASDAKDCYIDKHVQAWSLPEAIKYLVSDGWSSAVPVTRPLPPMLTSTLTKKS